MNISIKRPTRDAFESVMIRYNFPDRELLEMSQQMARTNQQIGLVEDQKKQITSDFKAKIDKLQAEANEVGVKILNGYEMRQTRCKVVVEGGKKRFFATDSGKLVEERQASQADLQQLLPLSDEFEFRKDGTCTNPAKVDFGFLQFDLWKTKDGWTAGNEFSADKGTAVAARIDYAVTHEGGDQAKFLLLYEPLYEWLSFITVKPGDVITLDVPKVVFIEAGKKTVAHAFCEDPEDHTCSVMAKFVEEQKTSILNDDFKTGLTKQEAFEFFDEFSQNTKGVKDDEAYCAALISWMDKIKITAK